MRGAEGSEVKFICVMEMVVKQCLMKEDRSRTDTVRGSDKEDSKTVKSHWGEVSETVQKNLSYYSKWSPAYGRLQGFGYVSMWMEKWKQVYNTGYIVNKN